MSPWIKLTAFKWAVIGGLSISVVNLEAKPRIRLSGVSVSAGYSHGIYPYYYDPLFFGAFFHPGFYNGFAYSPNLGEVRLRTTEKTGAVYLDGAYAGELSKLKHIWLEPGAYNLAVRNGDRAIFERRIYVLTGKTLDLQPTERHP